MVSKLFLRRFWDVLFTFLSPVFIVRALFGFLLPVVLSRRARARASEGPKRAGEKKCEWFGSYNSSA